MKAGAKSALSRAIEAAVRKQFEGEAIDAVLLKDDWDDAGDPIIWVTVVFESKNGLDVRRRANLIGVLRQVIEEKGTDAFPVVSYRSKRDHDRLSAAA